LPGHVSTAMRAVGTPPVDLLARWALLGVCHVRTRRLKRPGADWLGGRRAELSYSMRDYAACEQHAAAAHALLGDDEREPELPATPLRFALDTAGVPRPSQDRASVRATIDLWWGRALAAAGPRTRPAAVQRLRTLSASRPDDRAGSSSPRRHGQACMVLTCVTDTT
jgi:hypothetical protein